jgi:hypothetical protein
MIKKKTIPEVVDEKKETPFIADHPPGYFAT